MRLHHVGYVVKDFKLFAASMPGVCHIRSVEDPLKSATLALYSVGEGSLVELIQPSNSQAYTWGHLSRTGEGLHHICYDGVDEEKVEHLISHHKILKIRGPLKAVLFDRPVIFCVTRYRSILEFIL